MNDFDKTYKQHLEELWGKVGFIVDLSQMIEYNLANIMNSASVHSVMD